MAIVPTTHCGPFRPGPEPTPAQARILEYVGSYRAAHGYSPTYQEIADYLGRSKPTVHEHIHALRRKGLVWLYGGRYKSRSVRLTGRWSPPVAPSAVIAIHRPEEAA